MIPPCYFTPALSAEVPVGPPADATAAKSAANKAAFAKKTKSKKHGRTKKQQRKARTANLNKAKAAKAAMVADKVTGGDTDTMAMGMPMETDTGEEMAAMQIDREDVIMDSIDTLVEEAVGVGLSSVTGSRRDNKASLQRVAEMATQLKVALREAKLQEAKVQEAKLQEAREILDALPPSEAAPADPLLLNPATLLFLREQERRSEAEGEVPISVYLVKKMLAMDFKQAGRLRNQARMADKRCDKAMEDLASERARRVRGERTHTEYMRRKKEKLGSDDFRQNLALRVITDNVRGVGGYKDGAKRGFAELVPLTGMSMNAAPKSIAQIARIMLPKAPAGKIKHITPVRKSITNFILEESEFDLVVAGLELEDVLFGILCDGSKRGKRDIFQVCTLLTCLFSVCVGNVRT